SSPTLPRSRSCSPPRRSTMDWPLARAAARRPHLRVRTAVNAEGVRADDDHVLGVATSEGYLPADLVVDAGGRRSPLLAATPARADQPADEAGPGRCCAGTGHASARRGPAPAPPPAPSPAEMVEIRPAALGADFRR
ncbi:MAG: hypothetical protein M3O55_09135, partial [Actinomycetota bacterium]|nr:hypothetical protein [Actinomycetota bacterium]